MDATPTPQEAEESLRKIRHQQADAVRTGGRTSWWFVLGAAALFLIYGLGQDLLSPAFKTIAGVAFAVAVLVLILALRRRAPIWYKRSWTLRHHDRKVTLGLIGIVITTIAVFIAGPGVLTAIGAPMPHTLTALVLVLVLLFSVWPFGPWYNRRLAQQVEAQERWTRT